MDQIHATVRAMLDDPLILAFVLHEVGERGGADELSMKMGYWQQADPFLWTLISIAGDLLGEVSATGHRSYKTTVFAGEYNQDGLQAGPFSTLDEAKASISAYLESEDEVTKIFDGCPWG